jgi:hypothetical protein
LMFLDFLGALRFASRHLPSGILHNRNILFWLRVRYLLKS